MNDTNIELLVGETFATIEVNRPNDEILFYTKSGRKIKMYHDQDCCERVTLEKIEGEISNIIDSPLTYIKEQIIEELPKWYKLDYYPESVTYTIFTFETEKGSVLLHWVGESNGYYSESVNVVE